MDDVRYFARLKIDVDGFKKDTIGLVNCEFENKAMITLPTQNGELHTRWILTEFIEKM